MKPRLLVRVPSWLGDLVASEPVLRALHADYAAAGEAERLSLAGPAHLLPLLDAVLPGARRIAHAGRGGERASDWRGHDVALLLTGSFRSAWTARRAGIPRRIGWARDARGWLLTDKLSPAREGGRTPLGLGKHGRLPRYLPRPFGTTCVELVSLLGLSVADTRPRLSVSAAAREAARARRAELGLTQDEPFVLVNAGAREGSAKAYPSAQWGEVIAAIEREQGLRSVLVGGPGEEPAVRAALAAAEQAGATGPRAPLAILDPVCDLPGLAAHCADSALVLTSDAGPRHVANAVGARLVVVCGPTDPRHTAEHLERTSLLREPVDCGPCHQERCPLKGTARHACMARLNTASLMKSVACSLHAIGEERAGAGKPSSPDR